MERNVSTILLSTLEAPYSLRVLAFFLCLALFVTTILSNLLVLGTVSVSTDLHKPMYAFMCNLIVADVIGLSVSLPHQLFIFLTGNQRISRSFCIAQMFWINVFSIVESLTLTAMSFDRYVAICYPLHYHTIVTAKRTMIIVTSIWGITITELLPITIIVVQLKLTDTDRQLPGIFCDYLGYARLFDNDTRVQETYSSVMMMLLFGLPPCLILFTYFKILRELQRTQSSDFKIKALNTFLTHFLLLALFFITAFITILVPRVVKDLNTIYASNIRCGSQFTIFLIPLANISIYLFRTKELRKEANICYRKCLISISCNSRHRKVCTVVE